MFICPPVGWADDVDAFAGMGVYFINHINHITAVHVTSSLILRLFYTNRNQERWRVIQARDTRKVRWESQWSCSVSCQAVRDGGWRRWAKGWDFACRTKIACSNASIGSLIVSSPVNPNNNSLRERLISLSQSLTHLLSQHVVHLVHFLQEQVLIKTLLFQASQNIIRVELLLTESLNDILGHCPCDLTRRQITCSKCGTSWLQIQQSCHNCVRLCDAIRKQ